MSFGRPLVISVALVVAGCEVSVFGSEPMTVISAGSERVSVETSSCAEPEDGARVRGGGEEACSYRCVLERGVLADGQDCPLRQLESTTASVTRYSVDLRNADGVLMEVTVCGDATLEGTSLHLGDSEGARLDGDDPARLHDASFAIVGDGLELQPSHESGVSRSSVRPVFPRAEGSDPTGCRRATLMVADEVVYIASLERGLCGPAMLRLDPPTDTPAEPDRVFTLALGGRLDGSDPGVVPDRTELCFW